MSISSGLIQKAVEAKLSAVSDQIGEKTATVKEIFSRRLENNMARIDALPSVLGLQLRKAKQSVAAIEKRLGSKIQHIAGSIRKQADDAPDALYQAGHRAVHKIRMNVDSEYRNEETAHALVNHIDRRNSLT
jgi:hypothetical protein